jgi:hypothetical protein
MASDKPCQTDSDRVYSLFDQYCAQVAYQLKVWETSFFQLQSHFNKEPLLLTEFFKSAPANQPDELRKAFELYNDAFILPIQMQLL